MKTTVVVLGGINTICEAQPEEPTVLNPAAYTLGSAPARRPMRAYISDIDQHVVS